MPVTTNAGGGGGLDPDELTAEAGDILKGKLGGVKGSDEPVAGTLELTGDAADSHVMSGKSYYNTNAKQKRTGSMPNNGAQNASLNCGQSKAIPAGYTTGGTVTANSLASQTGGTATAAHILGGQTAWVNGNKVTGTNPDRGAWGANIGINGRVTIPQGYHNGAGSVGQSIPTIGGVTINPGASSQTVSSSGKYMTGNVVVNGDANLTGGNIVAGKTIFGVAGNARPYAYKTGSITPSGTVTLTNWDSVTRSFYKLTIPTGFTPTAFVVWANKEPHALTTIYTGNYMIFGSLTSDGKLYAVNPENAKSLAFNATQIIVPVYKSGDTYGYQIWGYY